MTLPETFTLPRGRQSLERIDAELRYAAAAKLVVMIEYVPANNGDETKTYSIAPFSYRDEGTKFFGFDMLAKHIKCFLVANIIRVTPTTTRFYTSKNKPWEIELAS